MTREHWLDLLSFAGVGLVAAAAFGVAWPLGLLWLGLVCLAAAGLLLLRKGSHD